MPAVAQTRTAAREQFLADLLVTAIENFGYGWFEVDEYECDTPAGTRAVIDDVEGDEGPWEVDLDTIAKGLAVIRDAREDLVAHQIRPDGSEAPVAGYVNSRTQQRLYMSEKMRDRILHADRHNDAGELDVVDALAILECALLGAVTYA